MAGKVWSDELSEWNFIGSAKADDKRNVSFCIASCAMDKDECWSVCIKYSWEKL